MKPRSVDVGSGDLPHPTVHQLTATIDQAKISQFRSWPAKSTRVSDVEDLGTRGAWSTHGCRFRRLYAAG